MPRGTIEIAREVEHLAILDERGESDRSLEPGIPDELPSTMHRAMPLSRWFDERLLTPRRQGRLGTFAPVKGQEAAQVGSAAALPREDWVVPSYREAAAAVWRGTPLVGPFPHIAGHNEGGTHPRRPERPADRDPRRHPDAARGRHRLRHERPPRRPGRRDLLRRRGHVRGRLPRGDERHRRVPAAGGVPPPEQPMGHFDPARSPGAFGNARAEGARLRPPDRRRRRGRPLRPPDRRRPGRPGGVRVADPATVGVRDAVAGLALLRKRPTEVRLRQTPPREHGTALGGSAGTCRFAPLGSTTTVGRRILGAKP
jgi:Dehydrogenase E1 component